MKNIILGFIASVTFLLSYDSAPSKYSINNEMNLQIESGPSYSSRTSNIKFHHILSAINQHHLEIIDEVAEVSKSHKEKILCLALNVYHEARGSSEKDQEAVAYVSINRVKHDEFPDTLCDVIWQQRTNQNGQLVGQFSWTVLDSTKLIPKEDQAWVKSQKIAFRVYKQKYEENYPTLDITNGATYFYAPKLINPPYWAKSENVVSSKKIGQHIYIAMK